MGGRAHIPSQPCLQALGLVLSGWPRAPSPPRLSAELQPTPTHTHMHAGLHPAPHETPTQLLTPRGRHLPHLLQPWSQSERARGGGTTGCFLPTELWSGTTGQDAHPGTLTRAPDRQAEGQVFPQLGPFWG